VRESWENRLLDVAVGLAGVLGALTIAGWVDARMEWIAFIASGSAFGLSGAVGWIAYRRRRARKSGPSTR